jgi:hypothetical protein
MKKLAIAIIVMALVAVLVPTFVLAAAPPTSIVTNTVTVGGGGTGGTDYPYVLACWTLEPNNNIFVEGLGQSPTSGLNENMESGDPTHQTRGTQINPPMIFNSAKTINFFMIVGDKGGVGNLKDVYAYVYSPTPSPSPYSASTPPGGSHFKYKVVFTPVTDTLGSPASIAALNAAYGTGGNASLVYFNNIGTYDGMAATQGWSGAYTISQLATAQTGELAKGVAQLWEAQGVLTYEQPAGTYYVDDNAKNTYDNSAVMFEQPFTYMNIPGVEIDFNQINYGSSIPTKQDVIIPGDTLWGGQIPASTNGMTVRNIGNTWAQVTVSQDDMAFGKLGSVATTYSGLTPPTSTQSVWNVWYDAQMGSSGYVYYDPFVTATMPGVLGLSTMNELDFSIDVLDGSGSHGGTMTIGAVAVTMLDGGTANGGGIVNVEPNDIFFPITAIK